MMMEEPLLPGGIAVSVIRRRLPIRVSRSTMYRRLNDGLIGNLRIGRRLFVPVGEIARTLQPFISRPGPWLDVCQAHRIFRARVPGCSFESFRSHLEVNGGPMVRFGGRRLVSFADLEAIIRDQRERLSRRRKEQA